MSFNYVNIVGKECKGWLNLFFDDECIAMVNDIELADRIRKEIPEKVYEHKYISGSEDEGFVPH